MQDSGSTASSDEDGVRCVLHVFKTYGEARAHLEFLRRTENGVTVLQAPMQVTHPNGCVQYLRVVEKFRDIDRVDGLRVCRILLHSSYFTDRLVDKLRVLVRCDHDDCIERRARMGNGGLDQFFSWPEPGQPDSGSSVRGGETTTGGDR